MESGNRFSVAIVVFGLIVVLGPSARAQYGGGTGEPNSPYLIYTAEQLNAIGADPNDWDKHFQLMADLDLSAYTGDEFNIIGKEIIRETTQSRTRGLAAATERVLIPFTGTFDGGGHTISNFTHTCWDSDKVGLFGYVADPNARISNLELIDPRIYAKNGDDIGSLIGRLNEGSVVNCHIRLGRILADTASYVGSLVGHIESGTVADCGLTTCIVLCEGGTYVGALAGCLRDGTLKRCHADDGLALAEDHVGGLLGINSAATVEDCWVTATVTGNQYVGGLVGSNTGTITNAEAHGDVWGNAGVGGLVGLSSSTRSRGGTPISHATIDHCHASGTVMGQDDIGGLVGHNSGTVTECSADSDIIGDSAVGGLVGLHATDVISTCHATGYVTGDESVGGLVGDVRGSGTITACHATTCVSAGAAAGGLVGSNEGTVTICSATGPVTGGNTAGGLVGSNQGNIAACFATGDVTGNNQLGGLVGHNSDATTNCYATGSVSGKQSIGGLVGYHEAGIIRDCYSIGHVTGERYVGGLVGEDKWNSQVTGCFWDIETTGQTTSAGGWGKTTAEMQTASTFQRWAASGDEAVWVIDEGNDYPRLNWEDTPGQAIAPYSLTGSGTREDPFVILTASDLTAMGSMVEDWDKHFELRADVDLADHAATAFAGIGDEVTPFSGTFDGSGHVIAHLTLIYPNAEHLGFFGYVSGPNAVIRNVILSDPTVDGGAGSHIGTLVGKCVDGTITNCHVQRGVVSGGSYVGGLIGTHEGTVSNCSAAGDVSGKVGVGGLVGSADGTITQCHSQGTVEGSEHVGGLIGYHTGLTLQCYAMANVAGTTNVGGLTGCNEWGGTIGDCYATGSACGERYVGGLVGANDGDSYSKTLIHRCYSTGTTIGEEYAGGLVGFNSGGVLGCYWDIETSGQIASSGGTGSTTEMMQRSETFLAWGGCGGEDTWTLNEANAYPTLSWQGQPGDTIDEVSLGDLLSGAGTPDDPFLIYTAEELNLIGLFPCDWDKHFALMADIDLSAYPGTAFNVIGLYGTPFRGVLDGNGYVISNYQYTRNGGIYIGVFGYIEGPSAEIRNVGIVDPNVNVYEGEHIGALAGNLQRGTLRDCYVLRANIIGDLYVGGLVGSNDRGVITHCDTSGVITGRRGDGMVAFRGNGAVGGLAGSNTGVIEQSRSAGTVSGDESVGGLVGMNHGNGTMMDSRSTADITGIGKVGGATGSNDGTIARCCASGTVHGRWTAGGLVGANGEGEIVNSYSLGDVTGSYNIGGLVGRNGLVQDYGSDDAGTIAYCYSTGSVTYGPFMRGGGLVGLHELGTVTGCFWDTQTSGKKTSAAGDGKTTAEMMTAGTFLEAGWDFVEEIENGEEDWWWIDEGRDYPRLWWELEPAEDDSSQ